MTIDEAIKFLEEEAEVTIASANQRYTKAYRLGAEALKQIKKDRFIAFPYCLNSLPGETEE